MIKQAFEELVNKLLDEHLKRYIWYSSFRIEIGSGVSFVFKADHKCRDDATFSLACERFWTLTYRV